MLTNSHPEVIQSVIAVDPGVHGGVAIIINNMAIVYDIPTRTEIINKKKRLKYDLPNMTNLFKPFTNQNVLFAIEKVGVRPGESPISSFSFGEGVGYWKGIAVAFGFQIVEVTSVQWKNNYPEMLNTTTITTLRDSLKALRNKSSLVKDGKQKISIKKEMADLTRQIKYHSKDAARLYAAQLYPDIADAFKLKKDDGKAEAVLIARYAKEKYSKIRIGA